MVKVVWSRSEMRQRPCENLVRRFGFHSGSRAGFKQGSNMMKCLLKM